jgi:hypothetical protein
LHGIYQACLYYDAKTQSISDRGHASKEADFIAGACPVLLSLIYCSFKKQNIKVETVSPHWPGFEQRENGKFVGAPRLLYPPKHVMSAVQVALNKG